MENYFELYEFLKSDTAISNGIQNYPTKFIYIEHLKELRDNILNNLRRDWGGGIIITSGFRCPKLNNIIKGASKTSVHQIGYAVDLLPSNGKINEFIEFCKKWFIGKDFDQVIIEKSGNTKWVHVGLYSNDGKQRKLLFNISK